MKIAKYKGTISEYQHEMLERPLMPGEQVLIMDEDEDDIAEILAESGMFDIMDAEITHVEIINQGEKPNANAGTAISFDDATDEQN